MPATPTLQLSRAEVAALETGCGVPAQVLPLTGGGELAVELHARRDGLALTLTATAADGQTMMRERTGLHANLLFAQAWQFERPETRGSVAYYLNLHADARSLRRATPLTDPVCVDFAPGAFVELGPADDGRVYAVLYQGEQPADRVFLDPQVSGAQCTILGPYALTVDFNPASPAAAPRPRASKSAIWL